MIRQSKNMRLSHFKVRFADGADSTDALYANGQHQLEVVVEVLKEVVGRVGNWVNTPLTDSERASVTIVPVPTAHNVSRAVGWSCDTEKNEYEPGLWNRTGEEQAERAPRNIIVDPRIEIVSRYMRLEENKYLEPIQFMATIVLDGESVTNSYSEYSTDFKSSVFVVPTLPPTLLSTDLQQTVDYDALTVDNAVDVDVYTWEGTNGLRFVHNYGLVSPLNVQNEGDLFQTAYGFSGIFKGGVFKETSASIWTLNDLHKQLPAVPPGSDPTIRRKNSSVMSAAKLTASIPGLPNRDSESNWLLRDNFGTTHAFQISPYEGGNRLSVEPAQLARRPKHLRITLTNGQDYTEAQYANGLHQCKVVIEVSVERQREDGLWEETFLREGERVSATITLYSKDVNQPLPAGWTCDDSRNIYEVGLWNRNLESIEADQTALQETVAPSAIETIDRYMRLDTGASIESRRFMARIVIGGKVYTTNFSAADVNFDSWVSISPRRPYRVRVADLVCTVDHAYWDSGRNTDIDIWYWLPPSGLKFVSNKGLDTPLRIASEGTVFQTTQAYKGSGLSRKIGMVVGRDQENPLVTLVMLHQDLPELDDNYNRVIPFNRVNTIMRATWLSTSKHIAVGQVFSPWRLLDNYGCTHSFALRHSAQNIELLDYDD
ncbi:hypothetical protein [Pseudomonas sp. R3-18-08]|uniref:hypothetical protein n=1 Tax=Pseudomonas sp. R3-18-08 TaxID=1173283 RepID=UPI000F5700B0|nr:hypothetical protein [Pseudomonas sp. R3-18-08]AZF14537.1 hypothetical protein C4J92_1037 [Pseudomonas sp. R3-18-08]